MNKLIFATALTAAFGLGGVAVAQTTNDVSATISTQQTTATNTGTKQVPAPGSRNCIRETGSHITHRQQVCLPVSGQSYSREDLDRTGNPNLGQALQQLDPNVRIGH